MECLRPDAAISLNRKRENTHDGLDLRRIRTVADRIDGGLCHSAEKGMRMFEAVLGLTVAVALGVYLIITLIAPEKF